MRDVVRTEGITTRARVFCTIASFLISDLFISNCKQLQHSILERTKALFCQQNCRALMQEWENFPQPIIKMMSDLPTYFWIFGYILHQTRKKAQVHHHHHYLFWKHPYKFNLKDHFYRPPLSKVHYGRARTVMDDDDYDGVVGRDLHGPDFVGPARPGP